MIIIHSNIRVFGHLHSPYDLGMLRLSHDILCKAQTHSDLAYTTNNPAFTNRQLCYQNRRFQDF